MISSIIFLAAMDISRHHCSKPNSVSSRIHLIGCLTDKYAYHDRRLIWRMATKESKSHYSTTSIPRSLCLGYHPLSRRVENVVVLDLWCDCMWHFSLQPWHPSVHSVELDAILAILRMV